MFFYAKKGGAGMRKTRFLVYIITLFFIGSLFFLPSVRALAENTHCIASFSTRYNEKDGGRSENIRLSVSFIDGITLQAYGEFSFNQTVGKRTIERGFKEAKVIVSGEFVNGVGGGVCQVSTTLYNACLLAGLTVTEHHAHSLKVGYVAPSKDAMVSVCSDLKIFNPHPFPVRFSLTAKGGVLSVKIYGKGDGYTYETLSKTLGEIAPPPPIEKVGEREEILREERAGIKSVLYLKRYKNGKLVSQTLLRSDEYRAIQGIIVKKIPSGENKMLSNPCVFLKKML